MLVITFEESDGPQEDASACCGEGPAPNTPLPGVTGLGGGRTEAVRTLPRFGLPYLGYAGQKGLDHFGTDVFNAGT
ncbi:hypothetical protein ACH47Z_35005 [Streptomyces sp. NPDC020192]|uniref:hypothetical protein n=1 Tax=Streptomyces sp. NPDC020192 TaxID=3365066 RepID=UPI0037A2F714